MIAQGSSPSRLLLRKGRPHRAEARDARLVDAPHLTATIGPSAPDSTVSPACRTLLALRWKGTLDFWLSQEQLVGDRWPAIVFAGLARQDVDLAFDQLPGLVADGRSMRGVLNLLPGLMREVRLSISDVRAKCRNVVGRLQPQAAEVMREWFRLQNYPLDAPQPGFNPSLLEVLRTVLGLQSAPRTRSASLCGDDARPEP